LSSGKAEARAGGLARISSAQNFQKVGHVNFAKKKLSEAKLKTRSEASRQNISNFDF